MHFHHAPHPADEEPPTMPAGIPGLLPTQRAPVENQIFEEATTEVPVITPSRPSVDSPSAPGEEPSDPATAGDATGDPDDAAPVEDPPDDPAPVAAEQAGPEDADDGPATGYAPPAPPWADLAGAPSGPTGADTATDPSPGHTGGPDEEPELPAAADAADPEPEPPAPAHAEPSADSSEEDDLPAEAAVPTKDDPDPMVEDDPDPDPDRVPDANGAGAADPGATGADVEVEVAGGAPADDDEGTEVQALEETDAPTADDAPVRPGDATGTPIAVWSDEDVQRFRDEWRDLQVQFIDEPAAAAAGAKRLVTDAVETLSRSLLAQQDQLDPQHRSTSPDTEALRQAMRRYREFLDRVLAL